MMLVESRYRVDEQVVAAMRRSGLAGWVFTYACMHEHYRAELLSKATAEERRPVYQAAYDDIAKLLLENGEIGQGLGESTAKLAEFWAKGKGLFVELGCGVGLLAPHVVPVCRQYIGLDVSAVGLEHARRRFSHLSGATFIEGDLCKALRTCSGADVIYSNDVLEHLHPSDCRDVLRASYGALAPGGQFVAVTSSRLFGPFDASRLYVPLGDPARGLHVNETTYRELGDALRVAGFAVVRAPLLPLRLQLRLGRAYATSLGLIDVRFKAAVERLFARSRRLSRLFGLKGVVICAMKQR